MTQTAEYGRCGCRINLHRCFRTSSEIHAEGEREVRVFKGFRCRLSILTERVLGPGLGKRDCGRFFRCHDVFQGVALGSPGLHSNNNLGSGLEKLAWGAELAGPGHRYRKQLLLGSGHSPTIEALPRHAYCRVPLYHDDYSLFGDRAVRRRTHSTHGPARWRAGVGSTSGLSTVSCPWEL